MDAQTQRGGSSLIGALRLFVLLSGGALAGVVIVAIIPSLTQMAAHFSDQGDGAFIAQIVTSIAAATMAFGSPVTGWLATRIGKRRVLLGSALLFTVAGVAGAVAPDLWTMLASRLLVGLGSAGLGATSIAFLGDYYPEDRRNRLIGWYSVIGGVGTLVALHLAGPIVEMGGWRAPFLLYLIGLPVFLAAIPSIIESRRETTAKAAPQASIRGAYAISALTVLLSIIMFGVMLQGVFLLEAKGITSPSTQSDIILMATVGSIAGSYIFGRIQPRLGFLWVLVLTWALLAAGNIGFALTENVVLFGLFAGFVGFGSGLMQPLTQSTALSVVPPEASARAVGLTIGCIFLGQLLNPVAMAPLRAGFGIQGSFVVLGAIALAALVLTILWRMRGPARATAS